MPRRDNIIYRYTGIRTAGGAGGKYTFCPEEIAGLWAEVVQVATPVQNLGQTSAFTADQLYKVRMQTPKEPYNLELTRFLWVWHGREVFLQPFKTEVRSGTRSEICLYHCKGVADFR